MAFTPSLDTPAGTDAERPPMGWKGPDDSPGLRPHPAKAYTVGEMLALKWTVRARCRTCYTIYPVRLDVMVRDYGARATLWDREQACPKARCSGPVTFQAATTDSAAMWDLIWDRRGAWQASIKAVHD